MVAVRTQSFTLEGSWFVLKLCLCLLEGRVYEAAWCMWACSLLQMLFITHEPWEVNCEFCCFHAVSHSLFFSPVWSCFASWTQPCHAEPPLCPFYQGERPGHVLHTCSFQITVSYAHLFSISCRMGWWCSVLRIVTRRNTWLPCYTSQYEHHSSLSPSVLGQCSLRRKCFSSPNVFLLCAVANELWLHVVSETSGSPTFALFSWSHCGSSWKWQLRVS